MFEFHSMDRKNQNKPQKTFRKKSLISFFFSWASKKNSLSKKKNKERTLIAKQPPVLKTMLKPFTEKDLDFINEPNPFIEDISFVGIGAPKCGTTWWQTLINEHPMITPNQLFNKTPSQELMYFPHFSYKGISDEIKATYKKTFRREPGKICGEFTTHYLQDPHCIEYLSDTAPDAKIIVILRNPIDRTISHLNHALKSRTKNLNIREEKLPFFKTFSLIPIVYFYSHYLHGLKELLKYFPRDNILILQYEKNIKDPVSEIQKTYQFLGVDSSFIPNDIERIINRKGYTIEKPEIEERKRIRDYFFEEVMEIKELFPEIDLKYWEGFIKS